MTRDRATAPVSGALSTITVIVPAAAAPAFADALEAFAASVSAFEIAPGGDWRIEAIGPAPDRGALGTALALVAASCRLAEPRAVVAPLPERNWLAANRRSFRPIAAGRFLVHPSHTRPRAPGKLLLRLDAGEAFGTGEHETTRGCLLALDRLACRWPSGRHPAPAAHALDLGCGSGILALAMALTWRMKVLAVDSAPEAVRTARANVRDNAAAFLVRCLRSDGFRHRAVRRRRYALITANILQRPLVALAPALAARLERGGRVVLSGFHPHQAQAVIAAHRARGLVLERRITLGAWCTLVMIRP
ncbi:MAG: 50S ribosomal protein L11 methyltransferase [Alphaproteobacteria bacterium]|nr:50S ribosomal protein L11 methyltransferase [Alphaproteobacteria bacterium]